MSAGRPVTDAEQLLRLSAVAHEVAARCYRIYNHHSLRCIACRASAWLGEAIQHGKACEVGQLEALLLELEVARLARLVGEETPSA